MASSLMACAKRVTNYQRGLDENKRTDKYDDPTQMDRRHLD